MKRAPLKLPPDTVGVAEAKRDLTALIDRVLRTGKPLTIARRGRPVVRILPAEQIIGPRWRKECTFADNDPFWAAMKDVELLRKTAPDRGTPQFPEK
ncbi:MAG: type II toxin-antitoxin system Phd/YefM family antitoxin [Planctomycetes bacterium]|nr:type II toxin-antitoxin system Phd/YefM family antitoxin [Planctomycetota bacterium]